MPPSSPMFSTDEAILRFSTESLHSFSYAIVSHNSISTRIAVLKRSLEYLRDNPQKLQDLRLPLSSPWGHCIQGNINNAVNGTSLKTSASSATLSMLNTITTPYKTTNDNRSTNNNDHINADPLDNLSAVLNILQNASSTVGLKGHNMSLENATTSLLLNGQSPSPSPSPSGPQSPPRKRTRTNISAAGAESQVLEALATPYIDVAWTSIMQRTGSVSSLSAMMHSMSSLNLANGSGQGGAGQISSPVIEHVPGTFFASSSRTGGTTSAGQITPLSSIASKFVAKHAVFTTRPTDPFGILSSNDIACLVFGLSQREMKSRSMLDVIPTHSHTKLKQNFGSLVNNDACLVVMCGALYPIYKGNGQESVASFWVKYNSAKNFLVWVVEEVLNERAILQQEEGLVAKVYGPDVEEIFPDLDITNSPVCLQDIFTEFEENNKQTDMEEEKYEYRTIKSTLIISNKSDDENTAAATTTTTTTYSPCYTRRLDSSRIQVSSLPNIAGVMMLNIIDYTISDYNPCVIHALFGHGRDELKNQSINKVLPHFTDYIQSIQRNVFPTDPEAVSSVGLVIPEHMFRKAAATSADAEDKANVKYPIPNSTSATPESVKNYSKFLQSTGITAVNRENIPITVDVQLRVVSPKYAAVWISYCRPDISGESQQEQKAQALLPSQLKLFQTLGGAASSSKHKASSTDGSKQSGRSSTASSDNTSTSATASSNTHTPTTTATSISVKSDNNNHSNDNSYDDLKSVSTISSDTTTIASGSLEIGAMRRTKKLTDFEVLKKMGEGAYGKVLLAKYTKDPFYTVVVKCVFKDRILVDTWTRDRKLGTIPNEIKVMATLNTENCPPHENIIKLLDFFEDDECYHIEMERHAGTDLFDLIELKPDMEERECKEIFCQVVDAVKYLHSNGIVHRDIKDENIIVDEETGLTKLIDFGSSAFLKQGPFDIFVGTIDYAAPEVLGGNPYSGKPQDVWALGILLYTIMYKENPFYNVDEIMDADLRIPFVPSENFLDLVKKMLFRDVNKRPNIEEVRNHDWFSDVRKK